MHPRLETSSIPRPRHRCRAASALIAGLACLLSTACQSRQSAVGPKGEAEAAHAMFDGASLKGWKVTDFAGHGEVKVADGAIQVGMGAMLSGISWTNPVPKVDYEIELQARRTDGGDFFCGLTFPVKDSFCSLIMGGWGGSVVGLSSLDGMDASENDTTRSLSFDTGRWYAVRLRVTADKIQAWLDGERVIDAEIDNRRVSLRHGEIEASAPLGIATYQTSASFRGLRWRTITSSPTP